MEKINIYVVIILLLCAISLFINAGTIMNIMHKKQIRKFYRIQIDAPTINVWQEVVSGDIEDTERSFDFRYDAVTAVDKK